MRELKLFKDGNQWCVLEGENLHVGVAGFGNTPKEAFSEYLENVKKEQTDN